MKEPTRIVKRSLAWFLLLTLCVQRVIGFFGTEVVLTVQVKIKMNETEKAIADKIKIESGHEISVYTVNEKQIDFLQGLGYGAPFIFTETIDSQVCSFVIEYPPRTILVNCDINPHQPESDQPFNTTKSFNEKLYVAFFFWEDTLPNYSHDKLSKKLTPISEVCDNPFIPIISPPPQTA